ncbi:MAG: ATP-binding protein [Chthoniobacteraceae bacterium]
MRGLSVEADAGRLRQMLLNLVDNAVKFHRDHGHLRIALKTADGEALLTVGHTSPGLSAEHRARIELARSEEDWTEFLVAPPAGP